MRIHTAKLAAECERAEGRLHALSALDGLGRLTPELVRRALVDGHPEIRRNAARLAEQFLGADDLTGLKLAVLITDSAPQVRMQAALSLGEWKDAWAGQGLWKLAQSQPDDPYLIAAVVSSLRTTNVATLLAGVNKAGLDHVQPVGHVEGLGVLLGLAQHRAGRVEHGDLVAAGGEAHRVEAVPAGHVEQ